MMILIVWWATLLLEAVVLFRCFRNGILREHPYFCVYLACVFISSGSGYAIYEMRPFLYRYWFWTWEFACVILGYSVVIEVLEKGLGPYEGPKKFARNAGLLVFASVVGFTTLQWILERGSSVLLTSVQVERNLRTAEAILLVIIVSTVTYYAIPVGRNLKGIVLGYGLCVATVVVDHALLSHIGPSFQGTFSVIPGYSYLASLLIWTVALWSYEANPVPKRPSDLASDYDALALKTRKAMESMRAYLGKAGRL
jgi:hypothetical protein